MRKRENKLLKASISALLAISITPAIAFGDIDVNTNPEVASPGSKSSPVPPNENEPDKLRDDNVVDESDNEESENPTDDAKTNEGSAPDESDISEKPIEDEGVPLIPEEANSQEAGPTAFVSGLYREILDRGPDSAGLASHVNALSSGASPAQVAWSFFSSPEYERRGLSREQKIETAYRAMFNRGADMSGMATYKSMLDCGMSLRAVISAFSQSPEYRAMCTKHGMSAGALGVVESRDRNRNATAFVQRLYSKVLNREGDAGGLNSHTAALLSGSAAAQVAWTFLGSPEFEGKSCRTSSVLR